MTIERKLKITDMRSGNLFIDLLISNQKVATILASPFDAKIVMTNQKNVCLTPEERFWCQMKAKKSINC